MKVFITLVLASVACGALGDTASGNHSPDDKFDKWRSCIVGKVPADKKTLVEGCINKPGGTDMSKFRRGLECLLKDYGVAQDHKVDLKKMADASKKVTGSPELKKAFETCPKDEKNSSLDRSIKCVIDNLETSCTLPKSR